MKFSLLHKVLVELGLRDLFPDVLGYGSFIVVLFLSMAACLLMINAVQKFIRIIFYKRETSKLKEVYGKVKVKDLIERKTFYGLKKRHYLITVYSKKIGEVVLDNKFYFDQFKEEERLVIVYLEVYDIKKFGQLNAYFRGVEVVDLISRMNNS